MNTAGSNMRGYRYRKVIMLAHSIFGIGAAMHATASSVPAWRTWRVPHSCSRPSVGTPDAGRKLRRDNYIGATRLSGYQREALRTQAWPPTRVRTATA